VKVLILAGGISSEREVSLNSGKAIAEGLQSLGHQVKMIDTGEGKELLASATARAISDGQSSMVNSAPTSPSEHMPVAFVPSDFGEFDCVFIALHGGIGENGTLQALLDLSGVCYTGSGVMASALAMDKYRAKLLFDSVGVPTPRTVFFGDEASAVKFCGEVEPPQLQYPIIVKPNAEGSTVGLTLAKDYDALLVGIKEAAACNVNILIEEYIPGRELTVAILGSEVLPAVEIVPKSGLYDYQAKYTVGASEYLCPAQLDKQVETDIKEFAQLAYEVLGCTGYARVDFRLNPQNELFCLEVNTLPGMTATSLVPKAAKAAGISFEQLLERIVKLALVSSTRTH
jgi:D-alanine-D-alanine ligase